MSQTNIEESLEILEKQGWDMDALLKDFMRGTVSTVDSPIEVGGVVFHIPWLTTCYGNVFGQLITAVRGRETKKCASIGAANLAQKYKNLEFSCKVQKCGISATKLISRD